MGSCLVTSDFGLVKGARAAKTMDRAMGSDEQAEEEHAQQAMKAVRPGCGRKCSGCDNQDQASVHFEGVHDAFVREEVYGWYIRAQKMSRAITHLGTRWGVR